MKLKSPTSEPEKEQTWDFSIFMQVPAKALTAATTTPPGTLHTKKKTGLRAEALQNLSFYTQAHVTRNTHIYLL